jgi:hypothetical protein
VWRGKERTEGLGSKDQAAKFVKSTVVKSVFTCEYERDIFPFHQNIKYSVVEIVYDKCFFFL